MIEQGQIVGAETSFTIFLNASKKEVLRYEVKNTWFVFEMKYCAGKNTNQRIGPFVY